MKETTTLRNILAHVEGAHYSVPRVPCGVCGKTFESKFSLFVHKSQCHPKADPKNMPETDQTDPLEVKEEFDSNS